MCQDGTRLRSTRMSAAPCSVAFKAWPGNVDLVENLARRPALTARARDTPEYVAGTKERLHGTNRGHMRADIHDGPELNTLQSAAGYIDARPQSRQIDGTSCDVRPYHTSGSLTDLSRQVDDQQGFRAPVVLDNCLCRVLGVLERVEFGLLTDCLNLSMVISFLVQGRTKMIQ